MVYSITDISEKNNNESKIDFIIKCKSDIEKAGYRIVSMCGFNSSTIEGLYFFKASFVIA